MPDGGNARWQIDILAADKSTAAFSSFDRRIQQSRQSLRQLAQESMATAQRQADGFARMAAAQPSSQAAGYARLAAATARTESSMNVARLAEQSGAALAAMYGTATSGATTLAKTNEKVVQGIQRFDGAYRSAEVAQNRFVAMGVDRLTSFIRTTAAAGLALVAVQKVLQVGFEIGALGDQATQLGVSTDQLQAYRFAASQAGVEVGELDKALQTLNAQMAAAKAGDDDAIARFEKLGVKILDANRNLRPLATVAPEVARGLLAMGNENERNALAADMLSKAGAKTVSMLEAWSQGNEKLIATTREQNALASGETIRAWNAVESQLRVLEAQYKNLLATFALPIAMTELRKLQAALSVIRWSVDKVSEGWKWIANGGATTDDLKKRADTIMGTIDAMSSGAAGELDEIGRARLQGLWAEWTKLQDEIALAATKSFVVPPIVVKGDKPGDSNPTGNKAKTAGEKLDVRLRELQTERKAIEQALATFEVRGNETVAEAERRIDAQVKLDQKIFDVLKDVPPNSPLAQQLIQEATAISQLNQRLEEKKRLLTEAEGVTRQYGDGQRDLARATEQLEKMLKAGLITQGTFNAAMKAAKDAAADAERAYRGAQGGVDAFIAGIEQGLADMERANSAFNMGRRLVDEMSQALTDLATGAEVDFNRILQSFLNMIIQMEMRAAMSNIWNAIRGEGPTNQGIFGALGDWIFKGGDAGGGGGMSTDDAGWGMVDWGQYADGGAYPAGRPRIVGERGWELDVPGHSGTIYNQDQLRAMLGGGGGGRDGTTVIVQQHVSVGEFVTSSEYRKGLAGVKRAAGEGSVAAVNRARRKGGGIKSVFAGR